MSNEILKPLLETVKDKEGKPLYCCLHHWLIIHRNVSSDKLSSAWGVARTTITYWRRKLHTGRCECARKDNCKIFGRR